MILKHRDKNILRLEWLEPYGVRILEVFEENLKFLPLEMKGAAPIFDKGRVKRVGSNKTGHWEVL